MHMKHNDHNKKIIESFEAQKTIDALDWAAEKIGKIKDSEVQDFVKGFEDVSFKNKGIRKILRDFNNGLPDEKSIDSTAINKPKRLAFNKILSRLISDNEEAFHVFLEQNYKNYGMNNYKKGYLDNIITILCDNVRKIAKNNILQNAFNSSLNNITYDDLYFANENISSDDEIDNIFDDEDEFRSYASELLNSALNAK